NRSLETMMRAGTFREDLYYRLQVIELRVPPLRDRREEIPSLIEFFLSKYARVYRRPALRPTPALVQSLIDYSWPGNIRELENMMKRFVVLREEDLILAELAHAQQMAVASAVPPASGPIEAIAAAPIPAVDSVS